MKLAPITKEQVANALTTNGASYRVKNHVIEAEITTWYESYKIYTVDEEDRENYLLLHTTEKEEAVEWFIERINTNFKMPQTLEEMHRALNALILYRAKVREATECGSGEFDDLHYETGLSNALFFFFGE